MVNPRPLSKTTRSLLRKQLASWLKREGLTQAKLAQRLGVSARSVRHWLAGTRAIPPFLPLALRALADELRRKPKGARR